jgi:tRNA pseudouridine38/39 synthase
MEDNINPNCIVNNGEIEEHNRLKLGRIDGRRKKNSKGCSTNIMCHSSKRYVALKIMYFGQRFYGFASEAQTDPTVESEIFKALYKQRLIDDDKKNLQYSRCGRTDKGVSSVGQVISLYLRSNHKENGECIHEELWRIRLCKITEQSTS